MTNRDGKSSDFHKDRPSSSEYFSEGSMIYAFTIKKEKYVCPLKSNINAQYSKFHQIPKYISSNER